MRRVSGAPALSRRPTAAAACPRVYAVASPFPLTSSFFLGPPRRLNQPMGLSIRCVSAWAPKPTSPLRLPDCIACGAHQAPSPLSCIVNYVDATGKVIVLPSAQPSFRMYIGRVVHNVKQRHQHRRSRHLKLCHHRRVASRKKSKTRHHRRSLWASRLRALRGPSRASLGPSWRPRGGPKRAPAWLQEDGPWTAPRGPQERMPRRPQEAKLLRKILSH